MELQAHKSPISETSDTLTYGSLNSQMEDNKKELDNNVLGSRKNNKKEWFYLFIIICRI